MKTKRIILVASMLTFALIAEAQEIKEPAVNSSSYKTAIGLRAGETSGLTIKQFVGSRTAVEGIVGVWHHGFSATVLVEGYSSAFAVSGLNWYYGAGGHFSAQTGHHIYHRHGRHYHDYYERGVWGLGADLIFGIEYKIPDTPIAMSLDVKPYLEIMSNSYFRGSIDPGLGLKVVF